MISAAIKNGARQFCRFIEKPFHKYRSRIRQVRRWLRRIYYGSFIALMGFGLAIKFIPGFEDRAWRAIEWFFSQWYIQGLFRVAGFLVAFGVTIFFLWLVAQKITSYKDDLMEEKSETLKKALRPVASWGDIAVRFITVLIGVMGGLHIAQVLARWFGCCLIDTGDCNFSITTEGVFISLAAPGALLSVWNMLSGRNERNSARRHLLVYKMSILRQILDVILLVFSGILALVIIFGFVILGAVAFGYV